MAEIVETQNFIRRPFTVKAIQVTPENIEAVAKWCGGEILESEDKGEQLSRRYIKVKTVNPKDRDQSMAFLGRWVLKSGRQFKVYTDAAFRKNFELKE